MRGRSRKNKPISILMKNRKRISKSLFDAGRCTVQMCMYGRHVLSLVLCPRPLNDAEKSGNYQSVIHCDAKDKSITVSSESRQQKIKKTYTFDSVFGMFAEQENIFDNVSSVVDSCLSGYVNTASSGAK